jgi:hypothetical protein
MAYTFVRGFNALILHYGVDLAAPRGTPVHAVAGGRVVWAAADTAPGAPSIARGGGNVVHVNVGGTRIHQYAHLDAFRVRVGQVISAGAVVGLEGATGRGLLGQRVTGPHVHFAIWDGGRAIDPLRVYSINALIAAIGGTAPGTNLSGSPDERDETGLTFWGVVTFPRGHVLTTGDVQTILARLTQAGYFRDPYAGDIAREGLEGLLNAMVGRTWDDQLARDIQRGLSLGSTEAARLLPAILPFGDEIAQAIAGIPDAIGGVVTHAGQALILAVIALVGLYLLVKGGR